VCPRLSSGGEASRGCEPHLPHRCPAEATTLSQAKRGDQYTAGNPSACLIYSAQLSNVLQLDRLGGTWRVPAVASRHRLCQGRPRPHQNPHRRATPALGLACDNRHPRPWPCTWSHTRLGVNLTVLPSTLTDTLVADSGIDLVRRSPTLGAEEVLVVGYLISDVATARVSGKQLADQRRNTPWLIPPVSGLWRICRQYRHGVGLRRVWQRTNRLWTLIIAHTLLDVVSLSRLPPASLPVTTLASGRIFVKIR